MQSFGVVAQLVEHLLCKQGVVLRVAKRKSQKEGLYREMKERQRYEKPTTKRKRLKEEAVRNEKKRQSKQRMVFGF